MGVDCQGAVGIDTTANIDPVIVPRNRPGGSVRNGPRRKVRVIFKPDRRIRRAIFDRRNRTRVGNIDVEATRITAHTRTRVAIDVNRVGVAVVTFQIADNARIVDHDGGDHAIIGPNRKVGTI